jgi:uncharacterized membrane protein
MENPASTRAAKEFLVQCIVDEAQREGVPLTEIEQKMLYFSETHWSLPDIYDVNAAFEQEYNTVDYERKISQLIRNFKARVEADDGPKFEDWNREVAVIASEDHYLLVMIGAAEEPSPSKRLSQLLLVGVVAGMAALLFTFVLLFIARR